MSNNYKPTSDGREQTHSTPSKGTSEKPSFLEEVTQFVWDMSEIAGRTASQTGRVLVDTAVGVGEAIAYSSTHSGKAAVDTANGIGKAIVDTATGLGELTVKQTIQTIEQATQKAGETVGFLTDNWLIKKTAGFLKLDWLFGATDQVDVEKAQAKVRQLQQEYPNESPSQISHRIMVEKSIQAGGIGFASSLLPGIAVALLALDLAATTKLQAEMLYEIAAAYGLDLKDPARRGEVLAIFGLALGGGKAVRAGLGLLRNVPFAGAAIGASSNAAVIYSLGYAACRFYESKLNASMAETTTLEDLREQSDRYLDTAIAQQKVMDQILVHMILASYPEKSWADILPELRSLKLSPASVDAIADHIKSPQPLDSLVPQLNRDYAIPLLAQCYRIAQLDGVVTPAESQVMQTIAGHFDMELNAIQEMVESEASLGKTPVRR